jgi:hypothetical protein
MSKLAWSEKACGPTKLTKERREDPLLVSFDTVVGPYTESRLLRTRNTDDGPVAIFVKRRLVARRGLRAEMTVLRFEELQTVVIAPFADRAWADHVCSCRT